MIKLTSNPFRVTFIKKKTNARFFKYLEIGDVFTVGFELRRIGRTRSGLYASDYTFECVKADGEVVTDSMTANQAANCLENFIITEIDY